MILLKIQMTGQSKQAKSDTSVIVHATGRCFAITKCELTTFRTNFYYTFIPLHPYFFSKICKILKLRFSIKYLHKNTQLLVFFVF